MYAAPKINAELARLGHGRERDKKMDFVKQFVQVVRMETALQTFSFSLCVTTVASKSSIDFTKGRTQAFWDVRYVDLFRGDYPESHNRS